MENCKQLAFCLPEILHNEIICTCAYMVGFLKFKSQIFEYSFLQSHVIMVYTTHCFSTLIKGIYVHKIKHVMLSNWFETNIGISKSCIWTFVNTNTCQIFQYSFEPKYVCTLQHTYLNSMELRIYIFPWKAL